ncbi:class I SAM-dependent methyltransferase [Actinoallomurus sp. NBC_01490]|uniref:class I SAM-dependent methyltransferase n=1 Tax=Actinoallomurus sp. NBC_01490 TaxID=2903557 RepID=UPI002E34BA3D|nr:class I SAM-dependent methyltransferase [Actinoallomurus sp. NBC_01490]
MIDGRQEVFDGDRFAFGSNWRAFVELVDERRIKDAVGSLAGALGTTDLTGRSFLDVGCGSGLFSLAAHRMGARVRSFDYDPESVAATVALRDRFAPDADWTISAGSVLDEENVAGLGRFDIVYSWGVLHHTGELWRAMENAAGLVAPEGLLFISVYNDQGWESRMWRRVKRRYNKSGALARRLLVLGSAAYIYRHKPLGTALGMIRGGEITLVRPRRARGMSVRHDLIDWVGGYPFEVAKPEEVFAFMRERGFELRHLKTCAGGIGCNEYVFERSSDAPARG